MEEWRQISGMPLGYMVSSLGNVRGHHGSGRLHKLSKCAKGYFVVSLFKRQYKVHRLVCLAFNGESPEDKPFVAHKNGIRTDNRPENLYWASYQDNADDTARHNSLKGSRNGRSKLDETDVASIILRHAAGERISYIHRSYPHVCYATISHICVGRNWRKSLSA